MSSSLWTEKYKPEKISEIAGQGKAIKQIEEFFSGWKQGKALLLSGQPGIGKTLSIEVFCRENNWQLLQVNASDSRTSDELKALLGESSRIKPLFHKKKVMLIDEVDGISSTERGATKTLIDIIKKSPAPIVFIANDPWVPKLRSLRNYCTHVKFTKVSAPSIEKRMREILKKEGIRYDEYVLKNLARWSNGDIRSAIIDLQAVAEGEESIDEDNLLSLGFREREQNMFSILPTIFRNGKMSVSKKLIWDADKDADTVFWWLENNISVEFSSPDEIRRATDILSKADIFRNWVMKKQNWRFKAYMVDMMSAISVGRKEEPRHGWIKYEAPSKISMMAANKKMRTETNELYDKLGAYSHLSRKMVRSELIPYLKIIASSRKFANNGKEPKEKTTSLMSFSKDIQQTSFTMPLKIDDEDLAMILG